MTAMLSEKKPQVKHKRPDPKIEWNNRTEQSWIQEGFSGGIPHRVRAPANRFRDFLNIVDVRKGPVDRTVTLIVRLKAIDWSTPKHERKEYIYYSEDWHGKNWLGIPLSVSEHIEGKYEQVQTKPVYDEMTGDHTDNAFAGTREVYYIPFSKKKVDDIISKSVGTDRSSIKFVVKFGGADNPTGSGRATYDYYDYDRFVNWTFEELYKHHVRPREKLDDYSRPVDKTSNALKFEPS